MKNFLKLLSLISILFWVNSCSDEIKSCKGVVSKIDSGTVSLLIGDYTIDFDTENLSDKSDAIMDGDSIIVDYIGDLKEKHANALLFKLIPKEGAFVSNKIDTTKELLVDSVAISPSEKKAIESGMKLLEKQRNQEKK